MAVRTGISLGLLVACLTFVEVDVEPEVTRGTDSELRSSPERITYVEYAASVVTYLARFKVVSINLIPDPQSKIALSKCA
jgi:hypothetical protein